MKYCSDERCEALTLSLSHSAQKDNEKNHKVRVAIGNGVRTDVWSEFLNRFGDIQVRELYAATEGNIGFINYTSKVGVVGRVNLVHRVSKGTRPLFLAMLASLLHSRPKSTSNYWMSHHEI